MLVLIFWAAALGFGLVVLGILAYLLVGHLSRFRRAVEQAQTLVPAAEALHSTRAPGGRHRAEVSVRRSDRRPAGPS